MRIKALSAAIFGIDRTAIDSTLAEIAACAGKTVERIAALAGKLRDYALDRAAGGELYDSEGNGHNTQ
ncbi:hypothetical protein VXQ18_00900 [Brucella abortus]|nr:hypothetical protein [Brucella abortus]